MIKYVELLEVKKLIKRRKGCNDIVEEMLANENKGKSTVYTMHDDSNVSNYSEKLYPFLKELYSLTGLNIDDEFDLKKLDGILLEK